MLYWLLAAAFLVLAVALRLLAEDGPRNDEDEPPDSADGESGPDLLLAALPVLWRAQAPSFRAGLARALTPACRTGGET